MGSLRYLFEEYAFDTDRRELHRGTDAVSITPQVFDLLEYLIRNKERVVSKDDLIKAIWNGRSVSDAALTTRLNAARDAIGDSGEEQRFIKTLPRKGFRFVGAVREAKEPAGAAVADNQVELQKPDLALPDKPSVVVLPFENMSGDPSRNISPTAWWKKSSLRCRALSLCSLSHVTRVSPSKAKLSISRRSDAGLACAMCLRGLCARHRGKFASQGN